jgi:hypothetical protein
MCRRVCPFQQFHGDESSPIRLVNLVDGADVRVVQSRGSFSFPLETAECLFVVREIVWEKLERDLTTELQVLGLVDDTHPATAQFLEDAVV